MATLTEGGRCCQTADCLHTNLSFLPKNNSGPGSSFWGGILYNSLLFQFYVQSFHRMHMELRDGLTFFNQMPFENASQIYQNEKLMYRYMILTFPKAF
jgi:hypothetical protein